MRPDRLLVGEVREAEALDLLIALNAGVPAMCTIHGTSLSRRRSAHVSGALVRPPSHCSLTTVAGIAARGPLRSPGEHGSGSRTGRAHRVGVGVRVGAHHHGG